MYQSVQPDSPVISPTFYCKPAKATSALTLGDLLRWRAAGSPDLCAFRYLRDDGGVSCLTYGELDRRARTIAAAIQPDVELGQRALLVYPPGTEFIAAFMGCVYAGVLAVPSTQPRPNRPMTRIAAIAKDSRAVMALTTKSLRGMLDASRLESSLQGLNWIATDDLGSIDFRDWRDPGVDGDDLAFLQYTSGSTSDPKGVMISHRNLISNLEMIRCAFGITLSGDGQATDVGVSWLPPYHDMGLVGTILEAIYAGGTTILMAATSFLKRPKRWLQAISDYGASVSGAPNFAYDLCLRKVDPQTRAKLDLSRWRVAFCGAEPVEAETLRRFADAFAPCGFREEAFYPCYGLAETTLLATGGDCNTPPRILNVSRSRLLNEGIAVPTNFNGDHRALVSCGRPIHDEQLVIVDGTTRDRCPPGKVGQIWIKGPNVASGYWRRDGENDSTFAARIAGSQEGPFLRTGDLGFVIDDQLYVTGRQKELLIVRGRNHYPRDLERTMQTAHECLLPMAGTAFSIDAQDGEEIVLVQEVDRAFRSINLDQVIHTIRRVVAEEHEVEIHAVVLIRQASLPRTTSGKLRRHVCRQRYLDGDLKTLAQWTRPRDHLRADEGCDQSPSSGSGCWSPLPLPTRTDGTPDESEMERVAELIEAQLLEWLRDRGGVADELLDRDRPFAEFGIDSLAAVELIAELETWSGVELSSVTAWKYPTPAALARHLTRAIYRGDRNNETEAEDIQGADDDELQSLLAEVERMSDEEALSTLEDVDRTVA